MRPYPRSQVPRADDAMKRTEAALKVVAIIQARMGSTRLPGKVLADIQGQPMLAHVLVRTRGARTVNEVIVATTTESPDDVIVDFCREHQSPCFRGSEEDVLDRYYRAAKQFAANVVVRITSDCPLIDPGVIDKLVLAFLDRRPDYASNGVIRTYPRGLDTEVIGCDTLELAWRDARLPYQRSHVTPYIYENPKQFKILSVTAERDFSEFRWTVDTEQDLEFIRAVYARLGPGAFSWVDVIKLLESEPQLATLNQSVAQKALHEG